jgi:serine protease Do
MTKGVCRFNGRVWMLPGLGVLMLAAATWGLSPALATTKDTSATVNKAIQYADELSVAFEHAADTIRPSVVTIKAVKHFKPAQHLENGPNQMPGIPDQLPFNDDFLRRFFSERLPREMPPQQGIGSGVIVSADGYILTNNHVVAGADEVTVTLASGRDVPAKVVGTDPMSDLAVVQVSEHGLPAATLGDSDSLRVGEWVVAAGNPFGLRDTVTAGIVSAKGRANVRIAEYEDFIQTDAAINPGNSGGPLINLHGRVVGINTAIATRSGSNAGVGFAIPINMAKSVMESLIQNGQVVRGWLGVVIQPLNEEMARSFGYDSTEGALISDVLPDSPADDAGLKPGDIVVEFNGTKVHDMQQLRNLAAATEPGTKVGIDVIRDGKPVSVRLKVTQRDTQMSMATGNELSDDLGLTVADLTPQQAQSLGLAAGTHGVVVTQVDPNGLAYEAGIQPGDMIIDVQGVPVSSVTEFRAQLRKHDLKSGVRLSVQSGETRRFVLLRSNAE